MSERVFFDISSKSINKKNEELCGDKVEWVPVEDGMIVVLSDGLGSGVKANILATLTSKIIATMLQGGATLEDTVDTIVHTLPVCKVRKLAYSTFSILKLNYNGQAQLIEFDCPGCIFVRDGIVMPIDYTERVIAGKTIREASFQLQVNDLLCLTSDGVMFAGIGAVLNLGWNWESVCDFLTENYTDEESSARMSAALIGACQDLYMSEPGDDTTVAMVKVIPQQVVSMLSGPPKMREDDSRMVTDFMAEEGKKMVCGGSSGNLVARELGTEVTTDLLFDADGTLPAIGHIPGIDLVTEGVLTLRVTNEIIRAYLADPTSEENLKRLDEKNGAALIAKMLIEQCTHFYMFIGKAINPAHQNPNLPVDLSIKLRLLDELAAMMRQAGKVVRVKFY
ncbi:MAG TPA: serine/threonine-protein phosphatase [Firmicutes bacterium]|nr:serine/threonine-protein phosphatase [Bacillota bacterium]